jgi:hypothetical protein
MSIDDEIGATNTAQHIDPTADGAGGESVRKLPAALRAGVPAGIVAREGAAAASEAREAYRASLREGAPDPLDGLPERITAEGAPALAFDPLVVAAALDLRGDDGPAFQSLRAALKRAGVGLTEWVRALDAEASRRKRATKEAEREALQRAAAAQRVAQDVERAESVARIAAEREHRPALADHFAEIEVDGATFTMKPGSMVMIAPSMQGPKRTTLATFSAPIVAHTLELDAPDAKPRGTYTLSVVLEGGDAPREYDVEADRFDRMEWVGPVLGPRAVVAPGKGARDALRFAIQRLSSPTTRQRCAFTGWSRHHGRPVYLHTGGAIGAEGAVEGLAATPPAPVDRFALPAPPTGDELARSVVAVVELLAMEPAAVTVPMVALAFHAPLGGSRCAVHVNGPAERGKSVRASLVQRLFGAGMNAKAPPASWADGSTAIGIGQVLARAGDALVVIDDLRIAGGSRDEADAIRVDRVLRAHFNGAAPLKGRREGGAARVDPASRCDVLSTGETLPKGPTASTLNRVVTVQLDAPLPANIVELDALASDGVLAAGMSAYLRWLAPQIDDVRATARAEERAAALRWGFTAQSRATELLGGLSLGMEYLFRFLRAHGVGAADVERYRARAVAALLEVAGEHGARVADEGIAPRFLELIGQALRSGHCHVVAVERAQRPAKGDRFVAPERPGLWGYHMNGETLGPRGPRVGYLNHREQGAVCLEPVAALSIVKRLSRDNGQHFGADKAAVGAALLAADALARTEVDGAKGKPVIRPRVMGSQPDVWAVRLSALNYGPDDRDEGAADPDDGTGHTPEFPDDIDPFAR